MFTTIIFTFVVVIASRLVYSWGYANGYRDACHKYQRHLRSKDITILYPL